MLGFIADESAAEKRQTMSEVSAALKIEATFRGHCERGRSKRRRKRRVKEVSAAVTIEAAFRGHAKRTRSPHRRRSHREKSRRSDEGEEEARSPGVRRKRSGRHHRRTRRSQPPPPSFDGGASVPGGLFSEAAVGDHAGTHISDM